MKRIYIVFATLFLTLASPAQDFRKASWDMSAEAVKNSETAKPVNGLKKDDYLYYTVTIDNLDFFLTYQFLGDKLKQCSLISMEDHVSAESYYDDFLKISGKLETKYGPFTDKTRWKSDLYKDDPKQYGFAASAGHVEFIRLWTLDRTYIMLLLKGEKFKCHYSLLYTDKSYKPTEETGF